MTVVHTQVLHNKNEREQCVVYRIWRRSRSQEAKSPLCDGGSEELSVIETSKENGKC